MHVRIVHEGDFANGYGEVYLPHALARKYHNAARQWQWQYVFSAQSLSTDPRTGIVRRHRLDPSPINNQRRTERLFKFLNDLGRDVEIVVKPKPRSRHRAKISVVAA